MCVYYIIIQTSEESVKKFGGSVEAFHVSTRRGTAFQPSSLTLLLALASALTATLIDDTTIPTPQKEATSNDMKKHTGYTHNCNRRKKSIVSLQLFIRRHR